MAADGRIRVRRIPPAGLGVTLRAARLRAGLGLRETARLAGISHGYLSLLESGERTPSQTIAARLAGVLSLEEEERAALAAVALDDAGRDSPRRKRKAEHQREMAWRGGVDDGRSERRAAA